MFVGVLVAHCGSTFSYGPHLGRTRVRPPAIVPALAQLVALVRARRGASVSRVMHPPFFCSGSTPGWHLIGVGGCSAVVGDPTTVDGPSIQRLVSTSRTGCWSAHTLWGSVSLRPAPPPPPSPTRKSVTLN